MTFILCAGACGLAAWGVDRLDRSIRTVEMMQYQDFRVISYDGGREFQGFGLHLVNESFLDGALVYEPPPAFDRARVRNIFIEIQGRRLGSLADLTKESLEPFATEFQIYKPDEARPFQLARYSFYDAGQDTRGIDKMVFCDGEFAALELGPPGRLNWPPPLNWVKLSGKPEGPYYSLPLTRRQVIEVFGKPQKTTRSMPGFVGPRIM
jgi:hypothetical protein